MDSQDLPLIDQLLDRTEGVSKVVHVHDVGRGGAHLAERLVEGGASEVTVAEGEVNVQHRTPRSVLQHRVGDPADIGHLGSRSDDQRTGGGDPLPVGVGLGHREGVLAGRDIDPEGYGKVGCRPDGSVESGILAGVAAGPHPVGGERDALEPLP